MKDWLILADDLTGAADAAIAFATRGADAEVIWHDTQLRFSHSPAVVACTTETRSSSEHQAVERSQASIQTFLDSRQLFKKIDSLLRGHPALETAAAHRSLRALRSGAFAIIAPAFPATGRITL